MDESPLENYILSYSGNDFIVYWGVELLNTLFLYTAVIVAALYTAAGTLMFIVNRKWKFFYLPLLYAIFGVIIGCCYGYILCMFYAQFHHV